LEKLQKKPHFLRNSLITDIKKDKKKQSEKEKERLLLKTAAKARAAAGAASASIGSLRVLDRYSICT